MRRLRRKHIPTNPKKKKKTADNSSTPTTATLWDCSACTRHIAVANPTSSPLTRSSITCKALTRTWRKRSRNRIGILIARVRSVGGRRSGSGLVFFIRRLGRMEEFMPSIYPIHPHPAPLGALFPLFYSFFFVHLGASPPKVPAEVPRQPPPLRSLGPPPFYIISLCLSRALPTKKNKKKKNREKKLTSPKTQMGSILHPLPLPLLRPKPLLPRLQTFNPRSHPIPTLRPPHPRASLRPTLPSHDPYSGGHPIPNKFPRLTCKNRL